MSDHLKKRDGIYYFRRRVPKDLLPHYNGKREINQSLGVKDRSVAERLVRKKDVELDDEWQRLRAASKHAAESVSAPSEQVSESPSGWSDYWLSREHMEYEAAATEQSFIDDMAWESAEEAADELTKDPDHLRRVFGIILRKRAEAGADPIDAAIRAAVPHQMTATPVAAKAPAPASVEAAASPEQGANGAASVAAASVDTPSLGYVVEHFLSNYDQTVPMFKKHRAALGLLLQSIGDVQVSQIRQRHIDAFFDLLCRLPPRWSDDVRRTGVPAKELAEMEHPETLSPKTFEHSYKASVKPFLAEAKRLFGDAGFPLNLTVAGIKYKGTQAEGARKQRAFRKDELKRLFEGSEYAAFANDPAQAAEYWLPLIGLYTGARVNEICQLNPQCDIQQEEGIWFLDFTEESEADARVVKSVKTVGSRRKVPIHSQLLELGFLSYAERVSRAGAAILFPKWVPTQGKASPAAGDWFRDFLKETGLRDETHGKTLVGMHAFRHTLLNYGLNHNVANVEVITGHVGETSRVVRGYQGELAIANKKAIIEQIRFDVEPPRPAYNRSPAME